jgi:hypothetical protein
MIQLDPTPEGILFLGPRTCVQEVYPAKEQQVFRSNAGSDACQKISTQAQASDWINL